jgi:serralysin
MAEISGNDENNKIEGTKGSDFIFGRGGADTIYGGAGNDVIKGDDPVKSTVPTFSGYTVAADYVAKITFQSESAGYRNTLGMYVINEDGTMSDVRILFANASLRDSGGDLIGGKSTVEVELKAGQKIGYFVAPDAFSKSGGLLTSKGGHFELRDSGNKIAKVNDAADVSLVYIDEAGNPSTINTQAGTSLYFLNRNQNADGLDHARVSVDALSGTARIGFEDLLGGGDRDFDDVVFTVDVGQKNITTWFNLEPPKVIINYNDVIYAGDGNDSVNGNMGNDRLYGEEGNDTLDGGSGNDTLVGGRGDDVLYGRSGDDALYGEDGNDLIEGSSGNDRIWDGAGDDKVFGGTGRDTVFVGAGNDYYNGGDGFDIIDFSASRKGLTLDLSKKTAVSDLGNDTLEGFEQIIATKFDDTLRGSKNVEIINGGDGNDWFRSMGGADTLTGGAGKDIFAYSAKDVWLEKVHLGVDTIRDFNASEDKLDFFEITKNFKGDKYSLVKLEQTETGVIVYANLGTDAEFQQIAILDGQKAEYLNATMKEWLIV